MLRKTNTNKTGFTIIEVVITIAIGAAVMALVLNAVAGARRSQRNNARSSDVNQIAAAINQHIATRNALPTSRGDIELTLDNFDKFGHYAQDGSSINAVGAWDTSLPATAGNFDIGNFTGTAACSDPAHTSQSACTTAGETWHTNTGTAPTTGIIGGTGSNSFDQVVVFRQAGCANSTTLTNAGIREMAIIYRLEGQADISCLEI